MAKNSTHDIHTRGELWDWLVRSSWQARLEMTGEFGFLQPPEDWDEEKTKAWWDQVQQMAKKRTKSKDIMGKGYYQVYYEISLGREDSSKYAQAGDVDEIDGYDGSTNRKEFYSMLDAFAQDDKANMGEKILDTDYAIIKVGYEHIVDGARGDEEFLEVRRLAILLPEFRQILQTKGWRR